MNTKRTRIIYLDTNPVSREEFDANMNSHFDVVLAANPIDAYNILREEHIDLVISAKEMPEMNGIEFLEVIAKDFPKVGRILSSTNGTWDELISAVNQGKVTRIIPFPFNYADLKSNIQEAASQLRASLEKDRLLEQLERQNQQFEFILRQRLLS
ncbi:MAG: response regulator [Flavobacteriales bacterium]|nr:response regulator [Flavobacteriales bacterium]MDG1767443.1 response regulator [Flavobacteriales bacterium]